MCQWANMSKRFVAVFVTVLMTLSLSSTVMAMPAPHQTMAQASTAASNDCAMAGKMARMQAKAQQHPGMPCNCMGNCPDMASCSVAAVLPVLSRVVVPTAMARLPVWRRFDERPGITLQPDNPPPIA